ncbi:MAG: hypothetical protein Q8891_11410 [Bacteroidota bacterium]|jgi:hypothetical protein|nr:hypothetical protein [Bacteroidota bacterium]
MFFWNKICGLGLIFVLIAMPASAQKSTKSPVSENFSFSKINKEPTSDSTSMISPEIFSHVQATIPENFSTCNYGFFCKKELVVEKALKFPLRIRLGSLQQCDYYEGKR